MKVLLRTKPKNLKIVEVNSFVIMLKRRVDGSSSDGEDKPVEQLWVYIMIVPFEAQVETISMYNGSTAIPIHSASAMSVMNLTTEEFCLHLKANLTDLQQSEVDWASYGCLDHAPHLTNKVVLKVVVLSLMGFFSLVGNIATIWNIQKNRASRRALRHSCSAIYALILHLSVADILVTFFCIIGEALWSYTVQWIAGEFVCKLVKILQMFALYLSTNVLVLIGIDRWVAVKYPMKSKSLNTSRFLVRIFSLFSCILFWQSFIFFIFTGFRVRYFFRA